MESEQTKKENESEEKSPQERFEQHEFRNITIYHMHKELVKEFKEWCKIHAGNKFPAGIQLLLSRAKAFDLLTTMESRIKALEQQVALLSQGRKSVEEHSEQKTEVKTIGGN
ncbi:hypothetical protein D6817_05540 [Candidatus Pacearchaeota archaeon]|nr:MAG: hypothetical protein DRJ17_00820 [Candidatus Woesearchaeota archaeon]RMD65731.1 MAG: hypothetical protein D6817_05540 [Candidatus Pacearchaeota archaeon]